jgi:hypothetical protein
MVSGPVIQKEVQLVERFQQYLEVTTVRSCGTGSSRSDQPRSTAIWRMSPRTFCMKPRKGGPRRIRARGRFDIDSAARPRAHILPTICPQLQTSPMVSGDVFQLLEPPSRSWPGPRGQFNPDRRLHAVLTGGPRCRRGLPGDPPDLLGCLSVFLGRLADQRAHSDKPAAGPGWKVGTEGSRRRWRPR